MTINPSPTVRVTFQQPTLAEYRIAFFRCLAKADGLDINVVHGESPRIQNHPADGFDAEQHTERELFGGKFFWSSIQWEYASKKNSDVLVLSCNLRYLSLLPSVLRAKINGVKVVLWGHHTSKSSRSISDFVREQIFFRLADSIVCYGHRAADRIRNHSHCKSKTFVAINSIDQHPIQQAIDAWPTPRLQQFQREHDLSNSPVLLFVSRIKPRNRLGDMVAVVKQLTQTYPRATGIVIGGQNEELRRIQSLAHEAGLENNFLFPGAIYDQQKLAPWFLSSDIFFYPAQVGLSMFHGFGYGLPAVVGDHPQLRNPEIDSLVNGENGFVFDQGDIDSAVEHIKTIVDDSNLKATLSRGAKSTVTKLHSISNMAEGFERGIRYTIDAASGAD